ncbi:phasin family protein [Bifidobacterium castoris]|uniref:Cytosolic protein n=1 Tax=Bifidobacterium castoris TaxID=2306972 RepID=A0A430F8Z1_9BIFI|nr:phasin family protein [Bifidobacterium castoris]MDE5640847.1 phasin family protein [Bifidobacterium castoris]RSX49287.1 cytosolic protein [Bifidobacterium castoris]
MTDSNNNIPDFGEGLRKIFLAGVGAIATTAEKGQELVNRLVERGELTVEQGKQLNSELARKAGDKKDSLKEKAAQASQTVQDAAAGLRSQASKAVDDLTDKDDDTAAADDSDK